MAPSLNTKTLSLCSLFSLLLFLHVLGSNAREMKVEDEHRKQNEASQPDKPYMTSYGSKRENEPYIIAYGGGKRESQSNYLTGYLHSREDERKKSDKRENQSNYLTGYQHTKEDQREKNDKRESQSNYLTGFLHSREDQREKSDKRESQSNYLIGYLHSRGDQRGKRNKRESQSNYLIGYLHSREDQGEKSDNRDSQSNYLTGYLHSREDQREKSDKKESQSNYLTSYLHSREDQREKSDKRESQSNYLIGYLHSQDDQREKSNKRESQSNYLTGYLQPQDDQREKSNKRESQSNYLTGYLQPQEDQREKSDKKESQFDYLAGYLHSQKDQKGKSESYVTNYGETKRENKPYITGYGVGKKNSHGENPRDSYAAAYERDSRDSYAATYRKEESGNADAPINRADHTEAFKTGFFAIDDLYVGNRMTLQFPIEEFPHFLTRKEAHSIPFSTSQLPSVLQLFSVPQDSAEAQAMRGTLEQCKLPHLKAETRVCVSSLESMIDFVRSIIGFDSQLDILTTTLPATSSVPLQNFTVLEISPDIYAPQWVACHPLPYPYAVFYCHYISSGTKIFKAKLGSENGEKIEAVGVCHLDTSEWSADHILFKQLGFKPGEAPVCHFFPVKHLMWVPLPSKATM